MGGERTRRRGFALPATVLLCVVVGITASAMLGRLANQRLVAERQLRSYRAHHMGKGVREVVGQWAISLSGQPLEKMIAPDGRVLDLRLTDGTLIRLFMSDGQGSVLADVSRLPPGDRADAAAVLEALRDAAHGSLDASWVRPVGPVGVSALSAPEPVLEAVARVVTSNKGQAAALVRAILEARRDGELNEGELAAAAGKGGIGSDALARFNRLLVPRPELWALTADVHGPGRDGEPADAVESRFRGLILLGQAGLGTINAGDSLGMFLTWEELSGR